MRSKFLVSAGLLVAAAASIAAQVGPPAITKGAGIDQKLNSPVPLDLTFRDESNNLVPLRTYFGEKPVVLALAYYRCPSLCSLIITEMAHSLRRISLEAGRDYNVVVVSIDPSETPDLAASKKATYAKEFNRPGFNAGWHFLTGTQDSISRLAAAVGFRYRWDEPTHQFVHAGGIMVATPEGKLSRYFYGVQYSPADLRFALVDASRYKIGTPVDYVLLFCFHYDATQGKYTLAIVNVLKIAGMLTVLALGALLFALMRPSKRDKQTEKWAEPRHAH